MFNIVCSVMRTYSIDFTMHDFKLLTFLTFQRNFSRSATENVKVVYLKPVLTKQDCQRYGIAYFPNVIQLLLLLFNLIVYVAVDLSIAKEIAVYKRLNELTHT